MPTIAVWQAAVLPVTGSESMDLRDGLVVVGLSFTIWAAGGAALARFEEDERRRL
jgi:hypothetical protein